MSQITRDIIERGLKRSWDEELVISVSSFRDSDWDEQDSDATEELLSIVKRVIHRIVGDVHANRAWYEFTHNDQVRAGDEVLVVDPARGVVSHGIAHHADSWGDWQNVNGLYLTNLSHDAVPPGKIALRRKAPKPLPSPAAQPYIEVDGELYVAAGDDYNRVGTLIYRDPEQSADSDWKAKKLIDVED